MSGPDQPSRLDRPTLIITTDTMKHTALLLLALAAAGLTLSACQSKNSAPPPPPSGPTGSYHSGK